MKETNEIVTLFWWERAAQTPNPLFDSEASWRENIGGVLERSLPPSPQERKP